MELGQAIFGNPTGDYEISDLGKACLHAVLDEIGRVFWNREQREWNCSDDPRIPGIEFRPYYWGDDEQEAALPNLSFAGVEIRWYKHPGRGTTANQAMSPNDWAAWLTSALAAVEAADEDDE